MFESAAQLIHTIDRASFKKAEPQLRADLLDAQFDLAESRQFPVVILFAGIDGAGKGAALQRLFAWLDSRHVTANAYDRPSKFDRQRPRMWRYWRDLPPRGEISIIVGHWYMEPLRARILGKTDDRTFESELYAINRFERMLANEGALVLKFWFHIPPEEQKRRLKLISKDRRRARHMLEEWTGVKLHKSASDTGEMMGRITSTGHAPWIVIPSADGRYRDMMLGTTILESVRKRLDIPQVPVVASSPAIVAQLDNRTMLDALDLTQSLDDATYEKELDTWQTRLADLTDSRSFGKVSLVGAFEGNDAAGKGGSIRRVIQSLDPRRFKVHSVAAPSDEELARPYLWRFWRHLPRLGRTAIFDRTWYGRVLVERVEGFCSEAEWLRAYSEINDFEEQMAASGIVVVKFWLSISKKEQLRRFKEREKIVFKRHKITDDDWRNRKKWDAYATAVGDMVDRTSTNAAPWTLIEAEDKKFARVKVIRTICERLEAAMKKV